MEPSPKNVTLVNTPASETMFEGQTGGWDGIACRAVVAQNQNELSLKKWLDTPKPFLRIHIPTMFPSIMA